MELLKIARRPALTLSPEHTVSDAAALMAKEEAGAVIVVNPGEQVLGIFSERDNLLRVTHEDLNPRTTRLADVMTTEVRTASPETSIDDALSLMIRNRMRHLPIVDASKKVLGVATFRYLLMRRIGEKEATLETLLAYIDAGGPG